MHTMKHPTVCELSSVVRKYHLSQGYLLKQELVMRHSTTRNTSLSVIHSVDENNCTLQIVIYMLITSTSHCFYIVAYQKPSSKFLKVPPKSNSSNEAVEIHHA